VSCPSVLLFSFSSSRLIVSLANPFRYDAIESVESRMQEVLSPTPDGEYVGAAVVQEVFNIGGTGNIAGSKCKDGIIRKGSNVRILRGDKILAESKVKTLRNFKVSFRFANSLNVNTMCKVQMDTNSLPASVPLYL
jgi:translation initiation factor IF-2